MRIAIVGAGLSGLYAAGRLTAAGHTVRVFEARARVGGRIKTADADGAPVDLGPAWFWPDHQTRLPRLLRELGIETFEQFTDGAMMFEPLDGPIQAVPPQPMGPPSYRIAGGAAALTDALFAALPAGTVSLASPVTGVDIDGDRVAVSVNGEVHAADHVMLAVPPRLAAHLDVAPPLPLDVTAAWSQVPTWMAAHAKVVAVYNTPFWRDAGRAGNAFSYRGPMMEIHDASPADGSAGALFGFVGVGAADRRDRDEELKAAAVAQLARLFGDRAAAPRVVLYEDWSASPFTATEADASGPAQHPDYGPVPVPDEWAGKLSMIGTEVAPQQGGYMEGCLIAVDAALSAFSENAEMA